MFDKITFHLPDTNNKIQAVHSACLKMFYDFSRPVNMRSVLNKDLRAIKKKNHETKNEKICR